MAQSFRKDRLKLPYNFLDSIVDGCECTHYRETLNPWVSFPELYRNLGERKHLHLRGCIRGKFGNYCAVFKYNPISSPNISEAITEIDTRTSIDSYTYPTTPDNVCPNLPSTETNTLEFHDSPHYVNDSMLIGIVYGMKNPECIVVRPCEPFVWLEALDNCDVFRCNAHETFLDFVCIAFNLIKNREFKVETPFVIKRELTQLIDQQVKSGTGIVGEIPNDKTPLLIGQVPDSSNDAVVWRVWVSLKHKVIRLTYEEAVNRYLDSVEMLTSPTKLQSWLIEWMHSSLMPSPHDEFYHDLAKGASIKNEHF